MLLRFLYAKPNKLLEKPACELARKLEKVANDVCNALEVESISGPIKIVEGHKPVEKNVVSAEKFYSIFNKTATTAKEDIEANAKVLEEANRNGPYW